MEVPLSLRSKFPPHLHAFSFHEVDGGQEYIKDTRVLVGFGFSTEFYVELVGVLVDQVFRLFDID